MSESGILIVTIVLAVIVQLVNPVFLKPANLNGVLRQASYILIPGIGMTLVLVAGGLDLSVGSVIALGGITVGFCMLDYQRPIWVAIVAGLLAGAIIGILNGAIIVRFSVPPMIITLGMMYIARGIVQVTTDGVAKYPLPEAFNSLEQSNILGIPSIIPFVIVLGVLFHIVLSRTTYGRAVFATGGNRDTARISGINVKWISFSVYIVSGVMAALSGLLISSRFGSGQPSAGEGYEMHVIAACIIGGTSTFGGRGTILGTAIGALFMSMLTNSMTLLRVNANYQKLVIGVVLVVAVVLDQYKREVAQKQAMRNA